MQIDIWYYHVCVWQRVAKPCKKGLGVSSHPMHIHFNLGCIGVVGFGRLHCFLKCSVVQNEFPVFVYMFIAQVGIVCDAFLKILGGPFQ